MTTTAAVLAGGASSRMGRDKALLNLGGRTFLQRAIDSVSPHAEEVLVVGRDGVPSPGLHFVPDAAPESEGGRSSLRGLHSALSHASGSAVLVVSCDMPFLDERLLSYLLSLHGTADVVVPQVGGAFEPLCSVYRKAIFSVTGRLLSTGQLRLLTLLQDPALTVRAVRIEDCPFPIDPNAFFNVNNLNDYHEAQEILTRRHLP